MPRKSKTEHASGYTLLVADDSLDYLEATRLLLEREGHKVLTASNGPDTLAILREQHVDLLLLDYFMPGMTGEEVIRELRQFDQHLQVVLQTGYASEKPPRELLRRIDIQGYHDKSEGPEKLLLWTDVGLKMAHTLRLFQEQTAALRQSDGPEPDKIVSGKLELINQAFDLYDCLEESLELLTPFAARKGVELTYSVAKGTPSVLIGNPFLLRQIFMHLLGSEVKFPEARRVTVSVDSRPLSPDQGRHEFRFSICQTGAEAPSTEPSSSGLSSNPADALDLSASRSLAELLGGALLVEGVAGQGLMVRFTLVAEVVADSSLERQSEVHARLDERRALVIADSNVDRTPLIRRLQKWGMTTSLTPPTEEVVEWLRRGAPFDVAIVDMVNSYLVERHRLVAEIRQVRDAKDLPMVWLTSLDQGLEATADLAGAVCLTEPVGSAALQDALIRLLG